MNTLTRFAALLTVVTLVQGCGSTPTDTAAKGAPLAPPQGSHRGDDLQASTSPGSSEDVEDLLQLAPKADAVVTASVASRHSYWNASRTLILTDYQIHVDSRLEGVAPTEFALTEEGGEVDGIGLFVSEVPSFAPNATYALLLRTGPQGVRVVGGARGSIRIDTMASGREQFLEAVRKAASRKEVR